MDFEPPEKPFDPSTDADSGAASEVPDSENNAAREAAREKDATASNLKREEEEVTDNIAKNLKDSFSESGEGTKSLGSIGKFLKLTDEQLGHLKSAFGKLFSGDEPPLGFKKDGTGKLVRDTDAWPENIGDFFGPDGEPNLDNLNSSIDNWKTKNGGKFNNLPDAEGQAVREYLSRSAEFTRSATGVEVKPPSDIQGILDKIKENDGTDSLSSDEKSKFSNFLKNYGLKLEEKSDELNKNAELNEATKGETGKLSKPKSSWGKLIGQILFFLEFAGSLATSLYFLIGYANAHTGCMKIEKSTSDSPVTSSKVLCKSNPTEDYSAQACYCEQADFTQLTTTPTQVCEASGDTTTLTRPGQSSDPTKICRGDFSDTMPNTYTYYSYQIMSPAGAGIDIAKKGSDIITKGFGKIMKIIVQALIAIGYVVGGLAVLFIIYKIVDYYILKKSKFGNINKFGNGLNKLSNADFNSNYFLKGNCKAISNIPSKPILFKKFSKMSIG